MRYFNTFGKGFFFVKAPYLDKNKVERKNESVKSSFSPMSLF